MTDEQMLVAARAYLRSLHTTLWADYDIHSESGLNRASTWLVAQIRGVERHHVADGVFSDWDSPEDAAYDSTGQRPL